jgi:hypothetical protein
LEGNYMFTSNKNFNGCRPFPLGKLSIAITVSFLALGAIFFTACESGVGAGDSLSTKSNRAVGAPIPITSAAELEKIGTDPVYYPIDGEYVLAADLVLTDWEPVPIAITAEPAFTGTFEGDGHTITLSSFSSAALSDTTADDTAYLGIFRQIEEGAVYDLRVTLALDALAPTSSPNAAYFGGVTGSATDTTFNRIAINGTLNLEWNVAYTDYGTGFLYAGGVSGDNSNVTITNSSNSAAIDVITTTQGSSSYTGGLIGRGDIVVMENCSASGDINAEGPGYNTSAGGAAGYVTQTKISGTHTTGSVTLAGTTTDFTGYNFWQVYAGGLAGYSGYSSIINKCSSTAGIVTSFAPYPYSGGLVGYNYGVSRYPDPTDSGSEISQCFADKTVNAVSQSSTADAFGGLPDAGGLVGYNSIINSKVENCYARGDVAAITDGQYAWAGGLAGANANNSVISKCYATGTVDVTTGSLSLPSGYDQPGANPGAAGGGIAGINYYTVNTIVEFCAALNKLIEGSADPTVYLLHRVVGDLGTDVTPPIGLGTLNDNIAFDGIVVEPIWVPSFGLDNMDGEDTVSKPAQSVYQNLLHWNFSTIWTMGTDGYPVLQ